MSLQTRNPGTSLISTHRQLAKPCLSLHGLKSFSALADQACKSFAVDHLTTVGYKACGQPDRLRTVQSSQRERNDVLSEGVSRHDGGY